MKLALDRLYDAFNAPESAMDPIQIVRRYRRVEDREIVAFIAAGLAFGRVASVMASIEAVCRVMGPSPSTFVREFDPQRDGEALKRFVHRWVKGADVIGVLMVLRSMIEEHGSIEACFASGYDASHEDLAPAIEAFARRGGKSYFFARPSTGSACKRMNLFLRWMIRRDGVDPGGWTRIPASKLLVPLDTHTIRVGKCLGLTRRVSPGWKMAADITAALRAADPQDPVRYDFALCHLSMMGGCGFGTKRGSADCPLKQHCRPSGRRRASRRPSARR
ncbi:MAG: TIGR02757 family protein [Acidobacteria bacterium]|nr:MAG: TIGR02757 family protein [Acidobacteriota bacterium]